MSFVISSALRQSRAEAISTHMIPNEAYVSREISVYNDTARQDATLLVSEITSGIEAMR